MKAVGYLIKNKSKLDVNLENLNNHSFNRKKVKRSIKNATSLLRDKIYPELSDKELIFFNNKFSEFLKF